MSGRTERVLVRPEGRRTQARARVNTVAGLRQDVGKLDRRINAYFVALEIIAAGPGPVRDGSERYWAAVAGQRAEEQARWERLDVKDSLDVIEGGARRRTARRGQLRVVGGAE
jgi:hypothetical protein